MLGNLAVCIARTNRTIFCSFPSYCYSGSSLSLLSRLYVFARAGNKFPSTDGAEGCKLKGGKNSGFIMWSH